MGLTKVGRWAGVRASMGLNQLRAPVGLNGLGWREGFGGGFFLGGGGV